MCSSADPHHLHQAVKIVPAGIIGDRDPIAGIGVQSVDVAVIVLAVGVKVEGGVVHILGPVVHLFPDRDLELLASAVGGTAAVDADHPAGHGEIVGLAAPDAVEHDVQRPVDLGSGIFGRGVGDAVDHQGVFAGGGPLGGVLLLHLVGGAEDLVGDPGQGAFAAREHQDRQHTGQQES